MSSIRSFIMQMYTKNLNYRKYGQIASSNTTVPYPSKPLYLNDNILHNQTAIIDACDYEE